MVKVKVCYATFGVDSDRITAVSLRGYLGYLFANDAEFHHHSESSNHYPKIQYKKINSNLMIIGFAEYVDIIFEKLSQLDNIITNDQKIPINNIILETKVFDVKQKPTQYHFVTPWIGLNETNYKKYLVLKPKERTSFLERILVGNILSLLKGFGIRIDFRIEVKIFRLRSKTTLAHNNKFAGFFCDWDANILLPENCGLGKSVSKGFGVIARLN